MKSSAETETAKMTEIVKTTIIILASEKWLFKPMTVLNLINAVSAAATV